MPLVGAADGKREWLKRAAALTAGMALVTGLFGAVVGGAGAQFAELLASRSFTAQVMKTGMIGFGSVMLVIGLGEVGLVRRFLPDLHLAASPTAGHADRAGGTPYRRAALLGAALAGSFGIICTRPTYLALLLFVAVVGDAIYGALAFAAYGVGLAIPVALGSLALVPASRSARLLEWVGARQEAIHVAQGVLFTVLGALVFTYFWFRYAVPAA